MARKFILPAALAVSLGACATAERQYDNMSSAEKGAVAGTVVGAGAGAIIAGRGDDAEGALIGAGIGAAAGYMLGNERDKKRDQGYQSSDISTAPFYKDENRYYDSQTGRYYYRDPATGATYYANGERRS